MNPQNTPNRAQRRQSIQERMLENRNQLVRPDSDQERQQRNIL